MKNVIFLGVFLLIVLSSCKSSAGVASSSSEASSSKVVQSNAVENNKDKNSEIGAEPAVIKDPRSLSSTPPNSNQSTPIKKYPSSGN